jgi:hypothetical protein
LRVRICYSESPPCTTYYWEKKRQQLTSFDKPGLFPISRKDPAGARIRASILSARGRGICSEVDGVSPGGVRPYRHKHALVYYTKINNTSNDNDGSSGLPILIADTSPEPILLQTPPPPDNQQALPTSEKFVDVVIDAAGKVRSASMGQEADKSLINSSSEWKFIPAFKDGHAVASRMRLLLTLYR